MGFQSLAGEDGGGRALLPALAFSVAIHLLLLWQSASILPRQAGGTVLAATLRAAAAPAAAPATEGAAPAIGPVPKSVRSAAAVPVIATASEAAMTAAAPEGPAAAAAPPGAQAGAAAAPDAPPGAPSGMAEPDADGIRDYRIGLAREARNHRRYPPLALERGWTGTAEIQVHVSRQGHPRHILLARSSGHEVLDREALSMMSRAAAAAALPDSLRGREFAVRLPVVFDLDEVR